MRVVAGSPPTGPSASRKANRTDAAGMDARETVEAYYDALRAGEPLGPFFAGRRDDGDDATVKFGISEGLVGIEAVRSSLARQTRTTSGWTVDSDALRVTERADHAWFSDEVALGWTDTERGIRFEFVTRWSGTLERRPADGDGEWPTWRFVGMHVSTTAEL